MNKKTLFQTLLFFFSLSAHCQTELESIFLKIKFHNIENSDKKSLIQNKKIYRQNNTSYQSISDIPDDKKNYSYSEFQIGEFLPKSGFLSLNETYINADGGYHYDLCYWNTSKNYKLVAVRDFEFATESFDNIEFYKYERGKITELNNADILPKLEFEDLIDIDMIKTDGLDVKEIFKIFEKVKELEFKLPKKGKNLIIQSYPKDYNLDGAEYEILEKFRKYFKRDIVLNWNDGKFELKK